MTDERRWWQLPDGQYVNRYGTRVTVITCIVCGTEVSLCPYIAPEDLDEKWGGSVCLGDACPSYDISRDIDMFFEPLAEAGLIAVKDRQ